MRQHAVAHPPFRRGLAAFGGAVMLAVAAVFAGLSSYPLAALGAIGVGLLESFGSFWASAYKEVIVFTSILPVLLWRSLRDPHGDEE